MSDTEATPDSPERVPTWRAPYRMASIDARWVVSEVLTEVLGTLRALSWPDHTAEQAQKLAADAIERVERAVSAKLREHGIEVDDREA